MKEPSPRTSRLAFAGGALAILVVAGAGFFVGRSSVAPKPAPVATAVTVPSIAPAVPALAEPARLDRAGLLALVASASDVVAGGVSPTAEGGPAAGRRFSIALPFGCAGPLGEADTNATGWRYDADTGALRLQVASSRWAPDEWFGDGRSSDLEAIEGFWVPRPWTTSETCPPAREPAPAIGIEPVTLAGQTLAIGQPFRSTGARQEQRDGAAYVAVVRKAPEALSAGSGFRIRLTGQLANLPGSGTIRCRQLGGPDQRPICLVGATFDEVALENAATGETLARWPGASTRSD